MHQCKWWKLNIDFVNCKSTPMTINAATMNISHLCQIDIVIVQIKKYQIWLNEMYFLLYMVRLVWFGLLCLMPLSTIFQLYIVAVSFIGGGIRRRKPQACRKSLTNSYHIMLYQVHLALVGFELTLVVIGTNYIGSCKSNYHTTTPFYIRHIMVHIFFLH